MLEKTKQVREFWSWLPAFRAVAETEHLPTAAQALGVSASALSRTIGLLEEQLGVNLFKRGKRRLQITEDGQRFLAAVRGAMRFAHEGLLDVQGSRFGGKLRIASAGLVTRIYVLPAIINLQEAFGELTFELRALGMADIRDALLIGDLDVAFTETPITHPDLELEQLSEERHGIFCAAGHPLFEVEQVSTDALAEHAFCAPVADDLGNSREGWPPEIERRIVLGSTQMEVGVKAAQSGKFLAVLPVSVANQAGGLYNLPLDLIPNTKVYAVRRHTLIPGRSEKMIEFVRREIASRELSQEALC